MEPESESESVFCSLVPELQLYILSFLTTRDLNQLATVSKKCYQLARHPSLKRKVILNGAEQTPGDMIFILNMSFSLRELEFHHVENWDFIVDFPKKRKDLLRVLTFNLSKLNFLIMSKFVELFPFIEEVNIWFTEFDYSVISEIVRWRSLKNISINANSGLTNENSCVSLIFEKCCRLRNLYIMGENVKERLRKKAAILNEGAEMLQQQFECLRRETEELEQENAVIRKQRDQYIKRFEELVKRMTDDQSSQPKEKKSFFSYFKF